MRTLSIVSGSVHTFQPPRPHEYGRSNTSHITFCQHKFYVFFIFNFHKNYLDYHSEWKNSGERGTKLLKRKKMLLVNRKRKKRKANIRVRKIFLEKKGNNSLQNKDILQATNTTFLSRL